LLQPYVFIAILLIASLVFAVTPLLMAFVIRPKRPNPVKNATYECGLEFESFPEEARPVWVPFRVQYYIYALVFVIFDIETVFLYPWAVAYRQLGLYALAEMFLFIAILVFGLAYAWRKGALEWV
jgi:NADH:ubiquinone oxidoreductase subunit 3 (subunit A)